MTPKRLVVTGASGFVGSHVVRQARDAGFEVWATGRESAPDAGSSAHGADYVAADLAAGWPFAGRVDAVIHLAGLAAVGPSFDHPQRYIDVNSSIMTSMCEALLSTSPSARVVVVSSGSVYRAVPEDASLDESAVTAAGSPYVVAKLLVERQAEYYASRGLDTVVARPFNHIGPGQGRGFLVPDLTRALHGLVDGETLQVGDLGTARDYTDVRDVARAYLLLAAAPELRKSVYNIASGASRTGREVLGEVADAMGVAVPPLAVDRTRLRPGDPQRITGSARRLRDEFGWSPLIDWRTSVRDYVTTWAEGLG